LKFGAVVERKSKGDDGHTIKPQQIVLCIKRVGLPYPVRSVYDAHLHELDLEPVGG